MVLPEMLGKHLSRLQLCVRIALAALPLMCMTACSGGGGSTFNNPSECGPGLADLGAELSYALNDGYGHLLIISDPSLQDSGNSSIVNHQQIVRFNENILATFPPEVASFMRYHEFGHMYLEHIQCMVPCMHAEYQADGYAARVLYQVAGAAPVQSVAQYFQLYWNQGDQTHRSGPQRSAYVLEVLNSLLGGHGEVAPAPPVPPCSRQTTGTLALYNYSQEAIYIYLNGQYGGFLYGNQYGSETLPAGGYTAVGYGVSGQTQYYIGSFVVDLGGTTTNY